MPDTPVTPELTRSGVLTSTHHEIKQSTIDTAVATSTGDEAQRLKDSTEMASSARKAKKEHPTDLSAELKDMGKVARFTNANLEDLKKKLLRGTPNEERVNAAVSRIENLIKYTEGCRNAETSGRGVDVEIGAEWEDIRKSVVDLIISDGKILEKFPDLNGISDEAARIAFIEEVVARDPRLQHIVSEELKSILSKAEALVPEDSVAKLAKLTDSLTPLTALQEATTERLQTTLKNEGLTDEQNEQIAKLIELGETPDRIMRQVSSMVKNNKNIDPNLVSYGEDLSARALHEKEVADFNNQLNQEKANVDKTGSPKRPSEIARLESLVRQAEQRKETAERNMEAKRNAYKARHGLTDDAAFEGKYQEFVAVTDLLKDGSPLLEDITAAVDNQTQIASINASIKEIESDPDIKSKSEAFKKQSEELTSELENLISTSMGRFIEKKIIDFTADQQTILNAAAREAEKNGEKWIADSTKKIKEKMKEWGHYNPATRKMDRNRDEIIKDIRGYTVAVANGEDGTKYLLSKVVGFNLDADSEKNELARTLTSDTSTTYETLTSEQKMQVDAVFNKKTADFNRLVAEHGDTIKENLMANYIDARGFRDKLGLGDLTLNSVELAALEKGMGALIDDKLEKNQQSKQILENLRAKGIRPDFKMKWLLYLLLGIGGLAVGAAGLAAVGGVGAVGGLGAVGGRV